MLVGREAELAALGNLLRGERLVTLTGPPGVGKTRLAIEYAIHEKLAGRPVAFLRLSSVRDPAQLALMISQVCSIDAWTDLPVEKLPVWANGLLVLDGPDYLPDAGATIVTLLRRCPALQVIVTARAALGLGEERLLNIGPLSLDAGTDGPGAAAALFLERSGHDAVDEPIVAATGGNPLAIIVLAARARFDGIVALDTAPGSGASLSDVVRWCIASLLDELQSLLRRLSVLAGAFTLEVANSVAGVKQRVQLEASIDELVDCGLIDSLPWTFPHKTFEMPNIPRRCRIPPEKVPTGLARTSARFTISRCARTAARRARPSASPFSRAK
jgi:predicted ATPase